ncbi:MAG: class I SAM-dependent methyltransferase [Chloroflexota bacterium]
MNDSTAHRLLDLNQIFYDQFAAQWDRSRNMPMYGFVEALPYFPAGQLDVLDVGCGNGRFSEFMSQNGRLKSYTGIDFSSGLLDQAAENFGSLPEPVSFHQGDLRNSGFLDSFATYDLITIHAVLHHIPQKERRLAIIQELATHLNENGMLMTSTWQFLSSERQRRKIVDWDTIGLAPDDVEAGDYLLTWRRGGLGYRYCCMVDKAQTAELAAEAGLNITYQFLEDGKERNLSLYSLMSPLKKGVFET